MVLLGGLTTTDTAKPILLERDSVHNDGAPCRMLTMSLDAQLQRAMIRMQEEEEEEEAEED